jgi:hypothetical protein
MYHILNVSTMKKRVLFSVALLLSVMGVFAQGNGMQGITDVRSGNQINLCHRRRGWAHRRDKGIFEVQ